ncbi:MAG: hypothetical protein KAR73_02850 [Spirochaetales bacterium]|nr:hypothetical protein [Spirochaetales bacterium]
MRHHKIEEWESKLKRVFDRVDDHLEEKYGRKYPLHPARPTRGTTSSKAHDGLFNLGASFSAGYGSKRGPGYVVEVRMVTLTRVPQYLRNQIEEEAVERLREELPREFPDRELKIERDGQVYKIHGDLRL